MAYSNKNWYKVKTAKLLCNKCGSDHEIDTSDYDEDNIEIDEHRIAGVCDVCDCIYDVPWDQIEATY